MRLKARLLYLILAAVAIGFSYMIDSSLRQGSRFIGLFVAPSSVLPSA